MYRTKKRQKTALCNGVKNRGKEQAKNKPIFSTPNRLAKGRVQVFYILQRRKSERTADESAGRNESPKVEVELKRRPMKRKM